MLGLKALELPTHPTRDVDVGALARLLETEPVAACLLSSSFNNPLGSAMAEADKRALLAVLAQHVIPLIEDDVYGDIHFGRERPKEGAQMLIQTAKVGARVCRSLSRCA